LKCIRSFIPGPHPFRRVTAILLRRKADAQITPYMSFFIAFSNYTFQIFIPLSEMDRRFDGKTVTIPAFPNIFESVSANNDVSWQVLNLSSKEFIREQSSIITMRFDEMIIEKHTA